MTVIKLWAESIKAGSKFSQIVLNFSNKVGMKRSTNDINCYINQCNYNIIFLTIDVKFFLDGIFSGNSTGQKWTLYSI